MNRLQKALSNFSKKKIFVVGDIMLDHYIYGAVERISPEAPVPIVRAMNDTFFLGGAANVAANVRSFDAYTDIMGRIGYGDAAGQTILRLLDDAKIGRARVFAYEGTQTIEKIRIASQNGHQLVRIDREYTEALSPDKEAVAISCVPRAVSWCDALIISDYNKGFITKRLVFALTRCAEEQGKIVIVDTKPAHFDFFKCVTAIKPNKTEAELLWGRSVKDNEDAETVGGFLQQRSSSPIVLTRGADGVTVIKGFEVTHIPSAVREVFDVTGAGDTVAAVLALGLASSLPLEDAALIANCAAGIAIGKSGTATVTLEELKRSMA